MVETGHVFQNSRRKKMATWIQHLIILLTSFVSLEGVVFRMEAEKYAARRFHNHRENASGEKAVNFNKGQKLNVYFCLRDDAEVSVNQVVYSNDGGSDTFEVNLDGKLVLGNLKTPEQTNGGKHWNEFLYSGQVGPNMTLELGRHTITLDFKETDRFGLDVDFIEIEVKDEKLNREIFECAVYCIPEIKYDNGPIRDDMPSAKAERIVVPVNCPTNDNILIPVYHEDIKHFLITATLPKYRSFENHYTGKESFCSSYNNGILWSFSNLKIPWDKQTDSWVGFTTLKYQASNVSKNSYLTVTFQPVAKNDLEIDNTLKISFNEPKADIYVEMKYKKSDGSWSTPEGQYITPQNMDFLGSIPRNTWSDTQENQVEITILADPETLTGLDLVLMLYRRKEERRREEVLFSDMNARVVATNIYVGDETDNDKMVVKSDNIKGNISNVSFISVYQKSQWSDSQHEILRLHQNGKLQLLPLPAHGFQGKMPFGTSVFLGAYDPTKMPPKAPIDQITIIPEPLELFLTYKDGSIATLLVKTDLDQTNVLVKDVQVTRDQAQYPFATVSSMWQFDGNADIDHVSTNGNVERHVMNGWKELYGTHFSFFRKCISNHNTLSPDIQLKLVNEEDLYLHL